MDAEGEKRAAQKAARHARVKAEMDNMSEEERQAIILARRKYAMTWYYKNPEKVKKGYLNKREKTKTDLVAWAKNKASRAKYRSKKIGAVCEITYEDILAAVPDGMLCPITGRKMILDGAKTNKDNASIDKIDPSKGYVKGNIAVISRWANSIKLDCTDPEVFRRLADWLERHS